MLPGPAPQPRHYLPQASAACLHTCKAGRMCPGVNTTNMRGVGTAMTNMWGVGTDMTNPWGVRLCGTAMTNPWGRPRVRVGGHCYD